MKLSARALGAFAAVLGAALALAAPAGAGQNDSVQFGPPSGGRQQLTVVMSDDAATASTTLYATYRAVDAKRPPPTKDACPHTVTDTRLIDGVAEQPGAYSVSRSVSLPLGVYAVCTYRATPVSPDPAAAALQGITVGGAFVPGSRPSPTKPATAISLTVAVRGTRATFSGVLSGTRTGRVAIQRRAGRRWVTLKHTRAHNGRYRVSLRVRHGARYRAVLVGTKRYATSRTPAIRVS